MRTLVATLLVAVTAGTAAARPAKRKARSHAHHTKHGKSRFETPPDADTLPAVKYGAMTADECHAELDARQIGYVAETAKGSAVPVRLSGPLHGVTFHSGVPEDQRETSPYEIADCRLVLALDDFAALLAEHDVVEVLHYSIYRPPGKSVADDAVLGQHAGALAIDAAKLIKADGTSLSVEGDFHGHIGAATCGKGAGPRPATARGKELRTILCDTAALHLFNVVLTPDFNRPHRNHFHLEVMANTRWFLVH